MTSSAVKRLDRARSSGHSAHSWLDGRRIGASLGLVVVSIAALLIARSVWGGAHPRAAVRFRAVGLSRMPDDTAMTISSTSSGSVAGSGLAVSKGRDEEASHSGPSLTRSGFEERTMVRNTPASARLAAAGARWWQQRHATAQMDNARRNAAAAATAAEVDGGANINGAVDVTMRPSPTTTVNVRPASSAAAVASPSPLSELNLTGYDAGSVLRLMFEQQLDHPVRTSCAHP